MKSQVTRNSFDIRLIFMALIVAAFTSATSASKPSPASTGIGQADFAAADRLAIHNVIYAYALYLDYFEYDKWLALYDKNAEFYVKNPGQKPFAIQDLRSTVTKRFDQFKAAGIRRRHMMNNIIVEHQDRNTAHATIMATLSSLQDGSIEVVSTIRYEAWFAKVDGIWKISKWVDGVENISIPSED